jgi:hypothetical protein
MYEKESEETVWEFGGGVMFYTRGFENRTAYRVLDFDDVIPIGASFGLNVDNDYKLNMMLSWFDPAGRDSLIENFGGFLQLEIGNLLEKEEETFDFAVLGQLEYVIQEKVTPYIRGGYKPQIEAGKKTDNMVLTIAPGFYLTPIHFFSFDLRYEMNNVITPEKMEVDKGLFSVMFTIRM